MESKIEYANNNSRPWESYHTVYTNAKAGMDGVDKEKVQRIVYEMSKGSKYFENEQRKEAFIKKKIEHMQAQRAKLTAADLSHYRKLADRRIAELEATRDLSNIWLHVDMDALYAAAETLSNQSLKGKPMAVGSVLMISTANYEARKFGVRAVEKVILDSKEKIEFYRDKMQLVLYRSRRDNRLNEITERAIVDKREAESLGKKYEEKYKQVAEIASKLTIEEAKFFWILASQT
ncbi:hypothetical protein ACFE04_028374 [Oxalis oulophora]